MAVAAPKGVQKRRLLRLTLAHYRNENCTEEEMHRWSSEEHVVAAARIHARHGVEGYALVSPLFPFPRHCCSFSC